MVSKAIILTNAPVTEEEALLIRTCDTFKVALNHHANELYPSVRFTSDYVIDWLLSRYTQPIFCVRVHHRGATNVGDDTFGSSIADCIRWLIRIKMKNILLVATNTVHSEEFQKLVYDTTRRDLYNINVYKYTNEGNFDLPYMSVKDFMEVRDE